MAMISSRVKCLYTGFLADPGERFEERHRLLASRDRELEYEVADSELGRPLEIRHHLFAHAAERRAARGGELGAFPALLGRRLGDRGPVGGALESRAHRDLHLARLTTARRQLLYQLAERDFKLLKRLAVADPPIAEASGPAQ